MANMYPKNIAEYLPEDSEKLVYYALKSQLPETFDVFYSVKWTTYEKGQCIQSEADFIVASPEYGFLCLEVKGGNDIVIDEDNHWTLIDIPMGIATYLVLLMTRQRRVCIILKRYIPIQTTFLIRESMQQELFSLFMRFHSIS